MWIYQFQVLMQPGFQAKGIWSNVGSYMVMSPIHCYLELGWEEKWNGYERIHREECLRQCRICGWSLLYKSVDIMENCSLFLQSLNWNCYSVYSLFVQSNILQSIIVIYVAKFFLNSISFLFTFDHCLTKTLRN